MLLQKIAKESTEKSELEEDDDAQYYREEVGEEPDKGKYRKLIFYINLKIFSLILQCNNDFSVSDLFQTKIGTKRPHKHIMRYKPKKAKLDKS